MEPSALLAHLEKLYYFRRIIRAGSFHQAAKSLRIAQPALSKSMRVLEEACQATFFVRDRSGVQLTAEGEILAAAADTILNTAAACQARLQALRAERSIGFVTHELLGPLLFPCLRNNSTMEDLAKRKTAGTTEPAWSLRIHTHPSISQLCDLIATHKFDCGVIVAAPARPKLHWEPLFTERQHLYAHEAFCAAHELSTEEPMPALRLQELPFVLAPDVIAHATETVGTYLERLGVRLNVEHQVASIESVAVLISNGFGIGLLPEHSGRQLSRYGVVRVHAAIPALNALPTYKVSFVCRQESWEKDPLMQLILNRIRGAVTVP